MFHMKPNYFCTDFKKVEKYYMTVAELLHGLATSAGIETDTPALKLILADVNMSQTQVPQEFESLVTQKYKDMITIEAAKQHPDLKKYFLATALYGVDKDIDRIAQNEFGFTDDERASLKKIENTQKRLDEFAKMTKEKLEKKAPVGDEEKHKKLQAQIADLNKTILEKDETLVNETKKLKSGYLNSLKDRTVKELFQQYNYTDAIPKKAQISTAQSLFFDDLKEKNYKVTFNEEGDSLKLLTSEDTEVFVNNKAVDVKQYVESLLAENKLLKVTPTLTPNGSSKKEPIIFQQPPNGQPKYNNSAFLEAVESAAQDAARVS